jgi:PAS domain S-box-containing protein
MEAMGLYDRAIRPARENDFVQQEAVAAETASRFYRSRGFDKIADTYLHDAYAAFNRWGAHGKVRRLEQRYRTLGEDSPLAPAGPVPSDARQLDILAVVRASQAIAGEIVLDNLLKTLIQIVLENAGARQGYLLLSRREQLFLTAECRVEGQDLLTQVHHYAGLPEAALPVSILNYVTRSRDKVLLDDATVANLYSDDEYFKRRRPKSVLCFPIVKQARLIGVLYLENDLATHAFTPQRLAILELLAAQAATSLENSQVHEALQEKEERLRLTFEATRIGTWDWDVEHDQWWPTPTYYIMLGYEPRSGPGDRAEWLDRVHPDDREHVAARMREVMSGDRSDYEYEARVRHADGSYRWMHVRGFGIKRNPQGKVTRMLGIRVDISERKQSEESLLRYKSHLEETVQQRTAELRLARDAADRANRTKSAFLANMSHEIRTPMNAIIGLTHLLRRADPTPQQAQRLEKIDVAANHLLSVINDVLDLSKIEAGKLEIEHEDFELGAVLDHVRSLVSDAAQAKGLVIEIDYQSVPLWLCGDPTRLRQALLNYVSNAVKFTERGRIVLRAVLLGEEGDELRVRFEVEDTGIGIGADKLATLFQAFEQADTSTTRQYCGTGLGLAITKRLAMLMGGAAGVRSTPGQGSTFWLTTVLRRGHRIVPGPMERSALAEAELRHESAGARLLLAEDDPINQEVALELLHAAGMTVEVARNGHQAVEMAARNRYDLILMHMQMPLLNGLDSARAIRRLPSHLTTPIVAMTANAFNEDRRACQDAGMNDFIAKPVNPADLYRLPSPLAAPCCLLNKRCCAQPATACRGTACRSAGDAPAAAADPGIGCRRWFEAHERKQHRLPACAENVRKHCKRYCSAADRCHLGNGSESPPICGARHERVRRQLRGRRGHGKGGRTRCGDRRSPGNAEHCRVGQRAGARA